MSKYLAKTFWAFQGGDFLKGAYSREHQWSFDGGVTVPASSAPTSVPIPYSNPSCVDPEEAFVASLSSCHLLTFLYLASKAGFEVTSYEDEAIGEMTMNERRVKWVSKVTLHPKIAYAGNSPSAEREGQLHHEAHQQCFIANSVKTEIVVAT